MSLPSLLAILAILGCILLFSRRDRKRKAHYIKLQNDLRKFNLETLDDVAIAWEELSDDAKELMVVRLKKKMEMCREILLSTHEGNYLLKSSANPDVLSKEKADGIVSAIENSFVDVLKDLKVCFPKVKNSDWLFCLAEYLKCPRDIIAFHFNIKTDSLRMRKMRMEATLPGQIFQIFF